MKRRSTQFAILTCVAIVTAAFLQSLRMPNEPSYNGRRLSRWLDKRVATPAGPVVLSSEASSAVREIGPEAIPFLLNWLQRSDLPGFRRLRYGANVPVPLNDVWRTRAFYGFRALGRDADSAVPELVDVALFSSDREVRSAATNALVGDNPLSVKLLGDALGNDDALVRFRAAEVLGRIRPPAAIQLLTDALRDSDPEVRSKAASGLGLYSQPLPDTTLDVLKSLSENRNSSLRSAARTALTRQAAVRRNSMSHSETRNGI